MSAARVATAITLTLCVSSAGLLPVRANADPSSAPFQAFLKPVTLFRDATDKKIRSISVEDFPRRRPDTTFEPGMKLTLDDTLSIVDTHYPKVLQGKVQIDLASARRLESQGAFDPFITHISEYKRIQSITNTGVPKNAIHNEGQLELPTRSGIRLYGRVRVNPNDASTPFLQSGRGGEYTGAVLIPLMRGLVVNPERAREQKARLGEPLSTVNFNLSRMNIFFDSAVAYWDWFAANQKVGVMKDLLDLAEKRLAFVRNQVSDGDLPALAITEAEKEIRRRSGELIATQRQTAKAAFKLSLFLWGRASAAPPQVTPANIPDPPIVPKPISEQEVKAGIDRALSVRPELAALEIQKEIVRVELKLAKNEMLPAVDLVYRQGADTGRDGIGMVMGTGVQMSIPLRQRRARGLIKQAQLELENLDLEESLLRRRITLDVQDTASELNASYERFVQAGEELERSRAVEAGERQIFAMGDSSLFLVNRREIERAEAEKKRIDVLGEYLKALAAFNVVTGNI